MKLYVKCTTDEYQLPEIVCDSAQELAKKTGRSAGSIATMISKGYPGWYKVDVGPIWWPDNDGACGLMQTTEELYARSKYD